MAKLKAMDLAPYTVDHVTLGIADQLAGTHIASPQSSGCWRYGEYEVDFAFDTLKYMIGFHLEYKGPITGDKWRHLISHVSITRDALEDLMHKATVGKVVSKMIWDGTASNILKIESGEWNPWEESPQESSEITSWSW